MGVAESKSEGSDISELTFGRVVTFFRFHFLLRALQWNVLCWMFLGPAISKKVLQILDILKFRTSDPLGPGQQKTVIRWNEV